MAIHLYFWQEKRDNGLENYGDLMSKYLVERISNRKVKTVTHPSKRLYKHLLKHYLVIGSILSSAQKRSVVWGSGIIKKDDTIREAKFLSVRGPKTRTAILEKGFQCPENYGDPALLMPRYYNPNIEKKYKLGIIPHYVDFKSINDRFKDNPDIKVINLLTNNVEKTTDEILKCESEGILGTTSNIIGSMQANEVLKNIISSDKSLHSSILVVNLKKLEFRKIKFTKKRGCVCS